MGDSFPWEEKPRPLLKLLSMNSSNTGVRGTDSESLLDDVDVLKNKKKNANMRVIYILCSLT